MRAASITIINEMKRPRRGPELRRGQGPIDPGANRDVSLNT
jgi:hypothetical protein